MGLRSPTELFIPIVRFMRFHKIQRRFNKEKLARKRFAYFYVIYKNFGISSHIIIITKMSLGIITRMTIFDAHYIFFLRSDL